MTQSGHSKRYYYYRAGRNLRLSLASSNSNTKMTSQPLLRFVICVVITSGIAAWSSFCEARSQVPGHTVQPLRHGRHVLRKDLRPERIVHPLRHGLHVFRKGVNLPSLHSSYPCSVLGHHPCILYGTYCSIFSHHPCLPDINYPIGQTLQLTIFSRAEGDKSGAPAEENSADHSPRDLNTIRDVFSALRACWVPPEKDVARSGTQITLRLSFNRYGGMISDPRTTYVTAATPPDVRQVYWTRQLPHSSGAHRCISRMGSVARWRGAPSQFGSSMIGLFEH